MLAERRLRKPGESVFVGVGPVSRLPEDRRPEKVTLSRAQVIAACIRAVGRERAEAALRDLGWRL